MNKEKIYICLNCGKTITKHASSYGKYCCNRCQMEYQSKLKYKNYLENPEKYYKQSSMRWVKKHILKEQNNKCAICGIQNIWNDKELIFILDHIDGRANNNNRNNLRLICPNCDSQLDTYKSKNKNSDRIYHRLNHR